MSHLPRIAGMVLAVLLLALPGAGIKAQGVTQGGALPGPLPILPANNWWNLDISAAPVDPASTTTINWISATRALHPDFGGDEEPGNPSNPAIYGFPYCVVPGTTPLEPITFMEYGSQSDAGAPNRPAGYPIPVAARSGTKWIEGGQIATTPIGGADRHMLIIDRDNRLLFELYHTHWNSTLSRWEAGSAAAWPLDTNHRRPDTWTSADAAGLAIFPGLVRYDEVLSATAAVGAVPIRHAFRMTTRATNGRVWPASHTAGSTTNAPPMGARFRLKASKNISAVTPQARVMFQAMKTYGLIVADNGSDFYIQGTYDTRWDNGVLNPAFAALRASDFEMVQLGFGAPAAEVAEWRNHAAPRKSGELASW
ncbi:MAG: hypothetical protein K1X53_12270 [Candidatus Sumerlaeaceae bacterium]|nr:hypothetical protein [Candidatus Sumerlaeaceae bacterium]